MIQLSSIYSEDKLKFADHRSNKEKRRMIMRMATKKGKDSLGRRVKDLRQAYEWQQEELAERMAKITGARVGLGYISDVERGRANPNWKTVAALAKALETSADYLVMMTGDPSGKEDVVNHHWSEEADAAGKLIDSLPMPEWRLAALEEVKRIASEWEEIKQQKEELSELLRQVEFAGGKVARAIVENYINTSLDALVHRGGRSSMVNEASSESTDI